MKSEHEQFDATVRKVLSVSHDELVKREQEWKRKRAVLKNKRQKANNDNENRPLR